MVGGKIGTLENRREFVLVGRDLVVTGGYRDPDLVAFFGNLNHEIENALLDGAEILVFQLLAFWGGGAYQCPAGKLQIGSEPVVRFVNKEILLFRAAGREHLARLVPQHLKQIHRCLAHRGIAAQERKLLIERFAGV